MQKVKDNRIKAGILIAMLIALINIASATYIFQGTANATATTGTWTGAANLDDNNFLTGGYATQLTYSQYQMLVGCGDCSHTYCWANGGCDPDQCGISYCSGGCQNCGTRYVDVPTTSDAYYYTNWTKLTGVTSALLEVGDNTYKQNLTLSSSCINGQASVIGIMEHSHIYSGTTYVSYNCYYSGAWNEIARTTGTNVVNETNIYWLNSVPSVQSVSIINVNAAPDDDLNCSFKVIDENANYANITWEVYNGISIVGNTAYDYQKTPIVNNTQYTTGIGTGSFTGATYNGYQYRCKVTAYDGYDLSSTYSDWVTVRNQGDLKLWLKMNGNILDSSVQNYSTSYYDMGTKYIDYFFTANGTQIQNGVAGYDFQQKQNYNDIFGSNNALVTGTISLVFGGAKFSGASARYINSTSILNLGTNYTVCAKVNEIFPDATYTAYRRQYVVSGTDYQIGLWVVDSTDSPVGEPSNPYFAFFFNASSGGASSISEVDSIGNVSQFSVVCAAIQNGDQRLYVNGVLGTTASLPTVYPFVLQYIGERNDGALYLNGTLGWVHFYNRSLSLAEIQALSDPTQHTPASKMIAAYPFRKIGNASDTSGNGLDGTVSGAAISNYGYSFDGINDQITMPTNYNFSSENMTFHFKVTSADALGAGNYRNIFTKSDGSIRSVQIQKNNADKFVCSFFNTAGSWATVTSTTTVQQNAIYNLACVKTDTQVQIYVNGINEANITFTGIWNKTIAITPIVGGYSAGIEFWYGAIGEVFIYNRSLSASEIRGLNRTTWNTIGIDTDYMKTGTANLIVGYDFIINQSANDILGVKTATNIGATFNTNGANFNGSQFMELNNTGLSTADTSFTSVVRFKTSYSATAQYLWSIGNSTDRKYGLYMYAGGSVYYNNFALNGLTCTSPNGANGNWHTAISTHDVLGNTKFYMDGVLCNSGIVEAKILSQDTMRLARDTYDGSTYFNGSISHFFLYNRTLTQAEITAISQQYSNASDKNGTANKAMNFTGKELVMTNLNNSDSNVSQITIAAWIKTSGSTAKSDGSQAIITSQAVGSVGGFKLVLFPTYLRWNKFNASAASVTLDYPVNLQDNVWHHVVGMLNQTTESMYIDSVLVNSSARNGFNPADGAAKYSIGANIWDTQSFNGSIDEVRIYNRALSDWEITNLYTGSEKYNASFSSNLLNLVNQTNSSLTVTFTPLNFVGSALCGLTVNDTALNCVNGTSSVCSIVGEQNAKIVNLIPFCYDTGDGGLIYNNENKNFYLDNVAPIIAGNLTPNGSYFATNVTAQFNFSDAGSLYRWNVSVDGTQIAGAVNVPYDFYSYNLSLSPRSLAAGLHTLQISIADGHTAKEINNYHVTRGGWFDNNYLTFDTGSNAIKINGSSSSDSFDYAKQTDRYTFDYTPSEPSTDAELTIVAEKPITIVERPDSKYRKWLVTGNNWIDFYSDETNSDEIGFEPIDDNTIKVTIHAGQPETELSRGGMTQVREEQQPLSTIHFQSVGDLNIVNESFNFSTVNYTVQYNSSMELDYSPILLTMQFGQPFDYNVVNATLVYNGTERTAIKTGDLNNLYFISYVPIPQISAPTNINFYWNITYFNENGNGTSNLIANYNQSVFPIAIADCASQPSWYHTLNFTFYDEDTLLPINESVSMNMDLTVISNGVVGKIYGFKFENRTNYSICLEHPDTTYIVNSQIEYFSTNYANRKYYLDNYTIYGTSQAIPLAMLSNTLASDIILTVFDSSNSNRIYGATIKILRYYPSQYNDSSAGYRTVEIEKTDINGQTSAKMVLADVWYKFIVEYPSGTVVSDTDIAKILTTSQDLPINIRTDLLRSFKTVEGVNGDVSCTQSTQTCRFTWSDTTNAVRKGELRVYQDTGFAKTLVYSNSIVSTAASIAYTVPNISQYRYVAEGWIYIE